MSIEPHDNKLMLVNYKKHLSEYDDGDNNDDDGVSFSSQIHITKDNNSEHRSASI